MSEGPRVRVRWRSSPARAAKARVHSEMRAKPWEGPAGGGSWGAGRRGSGACSEPGKDDGNAAADGFAGGEEGALGEEENGLLAGGLPLGDLRALEVELGGAGGRGDVGADEALLGLGEGEDAGDRELVGECLKIHLEIL